MASNGRPKGNRRKAGSSKLQWQPSASELYLDWQGSIAERMKVAEQIGIALLAVAIEDPQVALQRYRSFFDRLLKL